MMERVATVSRSTRETVVTVTVNLDGTGQSDVVTGLRFLDHLLDSLTRHSRMDVALHAEGDLDVDDHHTAEDCALTLGAAVDEALGDKRGIRRFADAHVPLDEAVARAVIDLSGRPFAHVDLDLRRERIGDTAAEMIPHVLSSFAMAGHLTLHVDVLRGINDHHRAEAAFKAVAVALRQAVALDGDDGIPSTKGRL